MADAKISTFSTIAANTATFTYAYVVANGAYGKIAINASGGLPVYTATALTPYADATNAIGTNALRWNGAVLAFTTAVAWSDGTHQNTLKYVDGTGPQFLDRTTTFKATFNVQSLSADRAYTLPNRTGTVTVDGLPTADNATAIGSNSFRWTGLTLTGVAQVNFRTATQTNSLGYADGTGPTFFDATTGKSLNYNVQSLSADRTATWPNASGTVTLLGNTATGTGSVVLATGPTMTNPVVGTQSPGDSSTKAASTAYTDAAVQNLYSTPTLVTLDHTTGGTFTAPPAVPSVIWVTSDTGVTIAGTTTIDASAGDLSGGWELVVTFIVASTTVAHSAIFSATGALALPIVATAGQSFRYIWDDGVSKWKRFS